MKKILGLFLLTIFSSYCNACLWEYRTKLDGTVDYVATSDFNFEKRFKTKDALNESLERTWYAYLREGSIEDYSDHAVFLAYQGNYLKAKSIFFEIESKTPDTYVNAANIGTVYELLGDLDSAMIWIKKSMTINANSHYGSEWIHLKILEAKKAANGNENFYNTHNILGVDFGEQDAPVYNGELPVDTFFRHLWYQLNERINFASVPDPIMGQLFFQFGNAAALIIDVEEGLKAYDKAKEFGYSSPTMDKRIAYFNKLEKKAEFKKKHPNLALLTEYWFISVPLLLIIVIPFFLIIRLIVRLIKRRRFK